MTTTLVDPTHEQLSDLMDFGHLVQVWHAGGHTYLSDDHSTGHSWPNRSPEENLIVYGEDPGDAQKKEQLPPGWDFVTGYTRQYGYRGPVMHDSEYIGGGLASAILEHEGFYVTSYIDYYDDLHDLSTAEYDGGIVEVNDEPYTEGWTVAYFGADIV